MTATDYNPLNKVGIQKYTLMKIINDYLSVEKAFPDSRLQ